ncbi:cell wall-binding repeat-containing protein [Plantibacter sp. T3]|uniref:cell wall-binding repeat-containing protein n=1 Tax=unclassified Plantibacter TaxID=2624265 RepID=UPI0012F0106A|nr:cell wall-binding repeat-containing protein [Plantibacter sp. T3]VXC42423.1 Cell wall-binding repeat-containing protein [Plantibacter sp. T3]
MHRTFAPRGRLAMLAVAATIALASAGLMAGTAAPAQAATVRLAGDDRFSTAVAISQAAFPDGGATVAYLATGFNFPDALSAAPAAMVEGGPLLLTMRDRLPETVRAELSRLGVTKVVVVGGVNAVDASVVDELGVLGITVERVSGTDRFATSRALIQRAFSVTGATQVFLATGSNFPDALSAGAASGPRGIPVLLVDGSSSGPSLDDLGLFQALGTTSATLIGGSAAIGEGYAGGLRKSVSSVGRIAGQDRYETSVLINSQFPSGSSSALIATGTAYADALAGAVLAGRTGSSLYVVTPTCLPPVVANGLASAGVTELTLLGGAAALSPAVADRFVCLPPPAPAPAPNPPPAPAPPLGSAGNPHRDGVTPGAFCKASLDGQYGRTATGLLMVCSRSATDSRLRWRQA